MLSRIDQARTRPDSRAVHVWGRDGERFAIACEVARLRMFRRDSGGCLAEHSPKVRELLESGEFQVETEELSWDVVGWRELGRELFRATVVDQEEETWSQTDAWGETEGDEDTAYDDEIVAIAGEAASRLGRCGGDAVLMMCTWRVFLRQRALLVARYGYERSTPEVDSARVLDAAGAQGEVRERLRQLFVASQAWW